METSPKSLQEEYAEKSICFGCGPANTQGLRIRSFVDGEVLRARFLPQPHHQAFPGVLNGGILGALMDCHGNWCACWELMRTRGLAAPPCTVTAEFNVKLPRPAPLSELLLVAHAVKTDGDRVSVQVTLEAAGKTRGTCEGIFVAVKEGHPAFHRW